MSIQFNADTIFEIGVQIEKNGCAFYLEAAAHASEATLKSLLTELAEWEKRHIALFEHMQAELPETMRGEDVFDPDNEFYTYLQAAANTHVFVGTIDVVQLVAQCQSPTAIFDLALRFEKDSVVYYTTLQKMVANHLGREKIDQLIHEELRHIDILNTQRQKYA